jgi:hypothetical protein
LTWTLRHAEVSYTAVVKTDGTIVINFEVNDVLDLRPGDGHTPEYNKITSILGPIYHDALGASDKMKVTANWQEVHK